MAMFQEYFIQQVSQATDIVDLVSQYVSLKKSGKEFVGLCPFHEDHKPSMFVSPAKQIFKCFACGAGGGVFQFLMLYEKQEFPEAVKSLAERAHIPLPREANEPPIQPGLGKEDLTRVMAWAAEFFQHQLWSDLGAGALEYARKRGLTDESIKRFGLGYAPDFWDGMLRAAARDHIRQEQLLAAGLIIRREQTGNQNSSSGFYDRFRNRLMFPIHDAAGKGIAFGGRALAANERAKYLNSPDTILFDKSNQLYALNWSREGISSLEQAVVVEGYMDAIVPLQCGLTNVVATLGTALTERHVKMLSRYAKEVVLVYDADVAGVAAAERALEMFLSQQLHVRVAAIPEGKDPCDFCLSQGGEAFKKLIAEAPDALEYAWQRRLAQYQSAGGNLADRRKVIEDFLTLVASSSVYGSIDEVRRGQLAQHIGHILNISAADLQTQMRRLSRRIPTASKVVAPAQRQQETWVGGQADALAQRQVLEVMLNRPDLFDLAAERLAVDDFGDDQYRAIAQCIWKLGHDGKLCLDEILPLESMSPFAGMIVDLATDGEKRGNFEKTLSGAVEHMMYCRNRMKKQQLETKSLSQEEPDKLRERLENLSKKLLEPDVRRHIRRDGPA